MIELREEPEDNAEEQYCHLMLAELRKSYELAASRELKQMWQNRAHQAEGRL